MSHSGRATRALGDLRPNPRNARTHSKRQLAKLARAIARFGFTNPLLIDRNDTIIAGHGRYEAAKRLGLEQVPVICLDHLTPAELRAYALADNRLAELAGWDQELLALEFQEILDLDIEISLTGFETGEIDLILKDLDESEDDRADAVVAVESNRPAISRPGDLWQLGSHRLLCGNARDDAAYSRLLGTDKAAMVFTDPPYNVKVDGHVSGLGAARHREFPEASGEMSPEAFTAFLCSVFGHMAEFSNDGALHFICMDWRHMGEMLAAGGTAYDRLINLIVWKKTNAGMGSLYRSQHELIFLWKHGRGAHINNVQLGAQGRYRSNVWTYPGVNSFRRGRTADLADHPTVKPVRLIGDAILDCSRRDDLVLDPFAGSGTTILAAEITGRCARAIEIDAHYVDTAIRRWQDFTGHPAHLADSGLSFDELALIRNGAPKSSRRRRHDDERDDP